MGTENIRKVNPNGGFVVPKHIRKDMKIETGDMVQFVRIAEGQYVISKVDPDKFNQLMTIELPPMYDTSSSSNQSTKGDQ
ncbi:AbrB/MazE/SpoVT family DNA-binding domain-containing protein [Paenibacillus polymyxa]|uniref:AbrB/MazE/SpoVT family DNA-binding domain-containing protein n=1 Tax=Paenibacillus polymyxa TaxID=1406 RepID=UPI0025B62ABB|nr:AbrB/MazE/SpoVT family DNA-binding domain-containing protein [Paenibacillus polymyxa]MDN4090977.1 AbrB/MazE/SpoVT family DNA-binding domain-containing protein [Paenibacillus polymyxa]